MLMLYYVVDFDSYLAWVITDAFFLVVLLVPVLYLMVLRPLMKQVEIANFAESSLRDSLELLSGVFSSINEAIFIVSTETMVITNFNQSAEKMFGYSREEMLGENTSILHIDNDWYLKFGKMITESYQNVGFLETTYSMKRKDGSTFPTEHFVRPFNLENGSCKNHVCVVRDISEHYKREEELKSLAREIATRNRFVESIITNLQSGIIVVDPGFRIKMVNSYVAELFGVAEEEFAGINLADISPELYECVLAGTEASELPANICNFEKTIGYNISGLTDAEGNIVDYIINFKDLTEVVRIRKKLRQKERLSAMGEVVARVAHEMRNPLFGMTAAAQILEMELTLEAGQQELMDSLLKESRRLNNLVEELLDTTREIRISKKRVNLVHVVEVSLKIVETMLAEKRVSLRKIYDGEVWVSADFDKLEQVIINLVRNALEASRSGGYISLAVASVDSHVSVTITDSGEGIIAENLDRIFDVFYTTKKNGTGMGLSICRGIVEAHGGSLTASNNPDGGSKFVMQLPCGDCRL